MVEIARSVRAEFPDRHIHLTTEDNRNITRLHERGPGGRVQLHTAEWNDDFHNVAHVIATGETDGYYADFAEDRWAKLGRALAEGFVYQGEVSMPSGKPRGEPSAHLPPDAFIDFLQNHDQVGNRAFGERLSALAAPRVVELLQAVMLLSPHTPLLFMGEEYGETRPFQFFTDFRGELAAAVREGRRREFAAFAHFSGDGNEIPDPNAPSTFEASRLDWRKAQEPEGVARMRRLRELLELRRQWIVPMVAGASGHAGTVVAAEDGAVAVEWRLAGGVLSLRLNLSPQARQLPPVRGSILHADPAPCGNAMRDGHFPGLSLLVARSAAEG